MDISSILVDYNDFKKVLKSITPPVEEVYICDISVREELYTEIQRINEFANVTYIDHHPTAFDVLERLESQGVTVVYSPHDCASILLYEHFKEKLGRKAARLAAYAAVSDQFEDGPIASKLIATLDKQFVQHEALILTHALQMETSSEFRSLVVEGLRRLTYPHKIVGAYEAAMNGLEKTADLLETLPSKAWRRGGIAFLEDVIGNSTGAIAGLLIDAMNVDVGVCYKIENDQVSISIRSRKGLEHHLGEISKRVSNKYGGFGGGHERASGARVPRSNYHEFLKDIELELSSK
jgi:RecJ-like exonuclease